MRRCADHKRIIVAILIAALSILCAFHGNDSVSSFPGYRYDVCAVTTDCDCESRVDLLRILIGVFRREGNVGAAHHGADGTWYVCGQCGRFVPR